MIFSLEFLKDIFNFMDLWLIQAKLWFIIDARLLGVREVCKPSRGKSQGARGVVCEC